MKHSPSSSATSPLQLPSQVCAMPNSTPSMSSYSPVSNGISPVTIIDETTSDVPLSNNMMASPFVPKIEDTCTDSGLYTMDSVINDSRSSMMSSRAPMMNESASSAVRERAASLINENIASSSQNKFMQNAFPSSSRNGPSDVNWLLSQDPYGNEPNIDNWLGQIFKTDNLVAGCSLPQRQTK